MTRAETQRRQVGRPDAGHANAILDIGEDPGDERGRLADTQRAILNILDDFADEKTRLEATQKALLNILDDFDAEKGKVDQINTDLRAEIIQRSRAEEALEAAQETLAHQAVHDPLTGLPNRALFLDRLTQALTRLERKRSTLAVFFLDLDGFKVINDSLGHGAGDALLVAVAARLGSVVRPTDSVARFGGDEFTILCGDLAGEAEAVEVAQRVTAAFVTPFCLPQRQEVGVTASIGIAFASAPTDRPENLIRDADAAMYHAKEQGRARHEIFDVTLHRRVVQRLETENALRGAAGRGELRVHYQPQVSLADGRVTGIEALVRWAHPDRGLLPPAQFIPLAEETGLIVEIGKWVIEEACRQAARWRSTRPGQPPLRLCVNVAARQLVHPQFVDVVARAIEATGVAASSLCLEITESALMGQAESHLEAMFALKSLGVSLGIDDFGTGYSSLAYLKRFPVDVLKIDKSFIDGLGTQARAAAIVATVINLAHALGITVVAEGVETAAHAAELNRLGCDEAQGYHFARPNPTEQITELLDQRHVIGRLPPKPSGEPPPTAASKPAAATSQLAAR